MSYQRLQNLRWVREHLVSCLKEELLVEHRPGEVWYNHNEYPALPHRPIGETDIARFDEYRSNGVEIIKLHQEWTDWIGRCGGDCFTSNDPAGLERLLTLAHSNHLRVHAYISSGFLDERDPAFRPEWTGSKYRLNECYWRNAMCSPLSEGWREYLLRRTGEVLDRYEFDGLYNDCGFPNRFHPWFRRFRTGGEGLETGAFADTPEYQPSFEDLLGELWTLLKEKRPSGLMTLHFGGNRRPPIRRKYYDRLYVGEGVSSLADLCARTKSFDPYTMLIPDARLGERGVRAVYAGGLPFLQFPVLYDGAPVTGERGCAEGVDYLDPQDDYWRRQMLRIRELRQRGAPPSFGWWDAVPGNPLSKPTYYHFLKLWRNIAANGTIVFLEAELEGVWLEAPSHLVQSVFVQDEIHLVVANHGGTSVELVPAVSLLDRETERTLERGIGFVLPPNDLKILRISRLAESFGGNPGNGPDHVRI